MSNNAESMNTSFVLRNERFTLWQWPAKTLDCCVRLQSSNSSRAALLAAAGVGALRLVKYDIFK